MSTRLPMKRITILDLEKCGMSGQDAERNAGVLPQCLSLSHLSLEGNQIGDQGAGRVRRSTATVPSAVLPESFLNEIGAQAADRLRAVWSGEPIHLVL
jgi:hypothetical protein